MKRSSLKASKNNLTIANISQASHIAQVGIITIKRYIAKDPAMRQSTIFWIEQRLAAAGIKRIKGARDSELSRRI
jgi:hypothetical protein